MDKTLRSLLNKALINHYKEDDWLVLSDASLTAALNGSDPLTREEYAALLRSPMTLRRMTVLYSGMKGVQETPEPLVAANDAEFWADSRFVLRAADSEGDSGWAELTSESGLWRLRLSPAGRGWMLTLELLAKAHPTAASLLEGRRVALVDGQGRTLLEGALDADGRLQDDWCLDGSPAEHFRSTRGGFEVRPC